MKDALIFGLGALCGAVLIAWLNGVRPSEPPLQVTLLARPALAPAVPQPNEVTAAPVVLDAVPIDAAPSPPALQETVALAPATSPGSASAPATLVIPVAGVLARQLSDSFNEVHGGQRHEAIDILAPRGTPVVAVDDGKIAKLFTSKPGGLTIYHFDPTEKYAYYYAHLDRYAQGITEGREVKRGEIIGYVGSTGNANPNAPHLHFTIFALGPEKRWWKGTAINPYPLLTAR